MAFGCHMVTVFSAAAEKKYFPIQLALIHVIFFAFCIGRYIYMCVFQFPSRGSIVK